MKLSGVSFDRKQGIDNRLQKAAYSRAMARSLLLCFSIFMQTQSILALFTTREVRIFFLAVLQKITEWATFECEEQRGFLATGDCALPTC